MFVIVNNVYVLSVISNSSDQKMPNKTEWGQTAWFFLHTVAAVVDSPKPKTESETPADSDNGMIPPMNFAIFLFAFASVLPCPMCRFHAQTYLKEHDPRVLIVDNESAQKYIYDMHNQVNIRNGTGIVHTFEEVKEAFSPTNKWEPFGGYFLQNTLAKAMKMEMKPQVATPETPKEKDAKENQPEKSQPENKLLPASNNGKLSEMWILLIVLGVVLFVVIGIVTVYLVLKKKKNRSY